MKKIIYITAFIILGVQLQFAIHYILEMTYIRLLLTDYEIYSFGFDWSKIYSVHSVLSVILLLAGITFGFWQGNYWWKYIYVDKKLAEKFKDKKGILWKILKY